MRKTFSVTVVSVKPAGGAFTFATPDTLIGEGDLLVVAGDPRSVEAFARL